MTSRSRILANLNSNDAKAATHPSHSTKKSSRNDHRTGDVNASHRRTVNTFQPENFKTTNLFSSVPPKTTVKKRGKENLPTKHKDEQKGKSNEAEHGLKVYQDSVVESNDTKKDDFTLICDEHASERYWELLAEERRKALKIALDENKELANVIKVKEEIIKRLEEEVTELKETVKHTEMITSVLENLLQADAPLQDTEPGDEEKSPAHVIDEAYTNASETEIDKDKDKVEFDIKREECPDVPLEQPLCSNALKESLEDPADSSNQRASNISECNEAAAKTYSEQE